MEPVDLMVRVDPGVRLHVRRFPGSSAQVPFLLVHGLSSNARLWDGVAARLATAGHSAYAVDLRSHGESDQPDTGYDTGYAVRDLAAVVTELDLPPAVVAGQSWGGNVVVRFASEHPERVLALALVDGGWIDLSSRFESWEECERALRPPELDGVREADLLAQLHRAHPDWEDWALRATVGNFRPAVDGRLTRRLSIPHHIRILRSIWEEPPAPYHASLTVPTLLVPALPVGDDRPDERLDEVRRAAEAIPHARIKEYAATDHDIHAHRPGQLAADLLELAAQIESARR